MSYDPISTTMKIASSGMKAQSTRLRVIAENLANAGSTSETPGGDPYRRKTVVFENMLDQATGADTVGVRQIGVDRSDFQLRYDPSHPAADTAGYVKTPNVNTLIEITDMKEAQRSYEANLNVFEQSREMKSRTLDLLKS